ncbi:unnamed protein product [Ascophyllum nodosum]
MLDGNSINSEQAPLQREVMWWECLGGHRLVHAAFSGDVIYGKKAQSMGDGVRKAGRSTFSARSINSKVAS